MKIARRRLRARFSRKFLPRSIPGLLSWVDFSAPSTLFQDSGKTVAVTADGHPIGAAADRSGNGKDAVQSTDGKRPTYKTNITNGKSVARFVGASGQYLDFGTALGRPGSYTIFVIIATTNASSNQYAFGSISSDGASRKAWGIGNIYRSSLAGSFGYFFGDDTNYSDGNSPVNILSNNTFAQITKQYTTGSTKEVLYSSGRQKVVSPAVSLASSLNSGTVYSFSLGRPGAYNGIYFTGDIAEFLVYSSVLTNRQRRQVEKYLCDKYALTFKTVTAYSAQNSATFLTTPTYDGSGQVTHPSVVDLGSGNTWNGYRYWMGITPYPNDNSALENPSILVSSDGNTWTSPPGLTNPIVAAPSAPSFNADPELILGQDNSLYCYYMVSDGSTFNKCYVKKSTDGVTWGTPTLVVSEAYRALGSEAVIWDGSKYVMWYVDGSASPYKVYRRTCTTPDGTWSAKTQVTMTAPIGRDIWHLSAVYDGSSYHAFITLADQGSSATNTTLIYASSADGLTWVLDAQNLLGPGGAGTWDAGEIYRSCAIKTTSGFDLWYSARNQNVSPTIWHIGRTTVTPTSL